VTSAGQAGAMVAADDAAAVACAFYFASVILAL
jgi:hypothetical protein